MQLQIVGEVNFKTPASLKSFKGDATLRKAFASLSPSGAFLYIADNEQDAYLAIPTLSGIGQLKLKKSTTGSYEGLEIIKEPITDVLNKTVELTKSKEMKLGSNVNEHMQMNQDGYVGFKLGGNKNQYAIINMKERASPSDSIIPFKVLKEFKNDEYTWVFPLFDKK